MVASRWLRGSRDRVLDEEATRSTHGPRDSSCHARAWIDGSWAHERYLGYITNKDPARRGRSLKLRPIRGSRSLRYPPKPDVRVSARASAIRCGGSREKRDRQDAPSPPRPGNQWWSYGEPARDSFHAAPPTRAATDTRAPVRDLRSRWNDRSGWISRTRNGRSRSRYRVTSSTRNERRGPRTSEGWTDCSPVDGDRGW